MVHRLFPLVLLLLAAVAAAGPGLRPNPNANDPYERIGATREMSQPELRRAYMLAVNAYNPSLNSKATAEQFASIEAAGRILFGKPNPPKPDSSATTLEAPVGVLNLDAHRLRQQLKAAEPMFEMLREAAYRPREASPAQLDTAARLLENELEVVRQDLHFVFGKMRAPTYGDLLLAIQRTERLRRDIDERNRKKLVESFVLWHLDEIERAPSIKDARELARTIGTREGSAAVFLNAIDRNKSRGRMLELLAYALTENGGINLSYDEKRTLIFRTFSNGASFDKSPYFGDAFADYLESVFLERLETPYDRKLLLESLEPALLLNPTPELVRTVSRLARADWLAFDLTALAQKLLKKWDTSVKTSNVPVRAELSMALSPSMPPLKRPLGICVKLLTKKAADFFYTKE